jgi:hypothetical protein
MKTPLVLKEFISMLRIFTRLQKKNVVIAAIPVLILLTGIFIMQNNRLSTASAQGVIPCTQFLNPREIPSPKIITFEELKDGEALNTQYQPGYGVTFPIQNPPVYIHAVGPNDKDIPHTPPNVARNYLGVQLPNTALSIAFDFPRTHVAMYLGNGVLVTGGNAIADVQAFDSQRNVLCQFRFTNFDAAHTLFVGIYDNQQRISSIDISYVEGGDESIDTLYLAPGLNPKGRSPLPKWTSVPTALPTQGPAPTATPLVPLYSFEHFELNPAVIVAFNQPDFAIHNIEITQGIQCFNGLPAGCAANSLPMVLSKDAAARIYLKANNSFSNYNNVPVRLFIHAFGNDYIANSSGKPTAAINQAVKDSADIYFNAYGGGPTTITFYAVVDPDNLYTEISETNNRFPATGTISMSFNNRRTMTVVGDRLNYHPGATSTYAGGWAVNGGAAQWWNQLLPLRNNAITYYLRSGYLSWTTSLGSGDGQHALISALNWKWIQENAFTWLFGTGAFTGARHVYGWAPSSGYSGGHADMPVYPHAGGLGVVGIGTDAPGTNTDNPGSGALIFGHELTHDYNIFHTDTADACGSNDSNSNYPYASSSIQAFGFNTLTGKIYDPATTHDLMSYCPSGGSKQGWISPFTWNTMYGNLTTAAAGPVSGNGPAMVHMIEPYTFSPTIFTQSLAVNATVYNTTNSGMLGTLERINGGFSYSVPSGDYYVELYDGPDGTGTMQASQSFKVDFTSEYQNPGGPIPPPPFPESDTASQNVSFIMPYFEGTQSIVLKHISEVLDTRNVSLNAPQVVITDPIISVAWPAKSIQNLAWDGSDIDGDKLVYSVYYSNDGGGSWSLIADNLTDPSYAVDVDAMAGSSDVRFRVVASDGVNTGLDETLVDISIPNHAPEPIITNPPDLSTHLPGDLIVFHGGATDMEDGTLADSAMEWSDDVQGGLGIGPSVPINDLAPGKHTITLTATDSYGISTSTSITIDVSYPIYLPNVIR